MQDSGRELSGRNQQILWSPYHSSQGARLAGPPTMPKWEQESQKTSRTNKSSNITDICHINHGINHAGIDAKIVTMKHAVVDAKWQQTTVGKSAQGVRPKRNKCLGNLLGILPSQFPRARGNLPRSARNLPRASGVW